MRRGGSNVGNSGDPSECLLDFTEYARIHYVIATYLIHLHIWSFTHMASHTQSTTMKIDIDTAPHLLWALLNETYIVAITRTEGCLYSCPYAVPFCSLC